MSTTKKRRGGFPINTIPVAYQAQVVAPITKTGVAPLQNGNPYPKGGKKHKHKSCKRRRKRGNKKTTFRFKFF